MSRSILFGFIIVLILLAVVYNHGIPETFFVLKEPMSRTIEIDPVELTRLNIKDYQPVFDGKDRVF